MSNITPSSPVLTDNGVINDLLRQLNDSTSTPGDDSASSSVRVSSEQLSALLRCVQQQQEALAAMTTPRSPNRFRTPQTINNLNSSHQPASFVHTTKTPEYYNNAKYEDLISKPLKPPYDGSSEQLVPFLNRLDIRRQDEGWYPITFITINNNKYDLIRDFTKLDESVMLQEALSRWTSPTLSIDKHISIIPLIMPGSLLVSYLVRLRMTSVSPSSIVFPKIIGMMVLYYYGSSAIIYTGTTSRLLKPSSVKSGTQHCRNSEMMFLNTSFTSKITYD